MGSLSPEHVGADVAAQHAQGLDAVPVLQPQRAGLPRHLPGHGHRDLPRRAAAAPFPGPGLPPPPPGARGAGMTIGARGRLGWTSESSENGLEGRDGQGWTEMDREGWTGVDCEGQEWTGKDGQGWTAREGGQLAPDLAGSQPWARSSPSCPQFPVPPRLPDPSLGSPRRICGIFGSDRIPGMHFILSFCSLGKIPACSRFPSLEARAELSFFSPHCLFSKGNWEAVAAEGSSELVLSPRAAPERFPPTRGLHRLLTPG